MAEPKTPSKSTTTSGDDAKTLEAKRAGDAAYVKAKEAVVEGANGFTTWLKGIFGADDSSSAAPANPTLPDIKNPELKAIAEKLIHYRGVLKAYQEKYGSGLDPKKRKDLTNLNAELFSEAGFNRVMKIFARKDLSQAYIKQMTDGFNAKFPEMEALEKEYDALEVEANKKKASEKGEGFDWRNLMGGGLTALVGWLLGSMFGAGPFGMIASIALAVGGFFIGNQNKWGDKVAGFLGFGKENGQSSPGQALQLAPAGPGQTQAVAQNNYQGVNQPFAYQNGMTQGDAWQLAAATRNAGFIAPDWANGNADGNQFGAVPFRPRYQGLAGKLLHPNKSAYERAVLNSIASGVQYAPQDFGQGYVPQPPVYYGAPPLGINNFSVQGRDVGLNYNQFGGMGARFRL